MTSDDNGQDLTNYNFATDGFRTANSANDVYIATGGNYLSVSAKSSCYTITSLLSSVVSKYCSMEKNSGIFVHRV